MQRGYRAGMGKIAPWHAYTHTTADDLIKRDLRFSFRGRSTKGELIFYWPLSKSLQRGLLFAGGKIQLNDALFRVWNDSPYRVSVCYNLDRMDGWNKFTTGASNCASGAKQRWKTLCLCLFFPSFSAKGTMNKWMKTKAT